MEFRSYTPHPGNGVTESQVKNPAEPGTENDCNGKINLLSLLKHYVNEKW